MAKQENQINIELPESIAEGVYCNLAIISHSQTEFIFDYIQMLPGLPKAKVRSRIIMTPQHAKRLHKALAENIRKYETQQGEIAEGTELDIPMNFGPTGLA